MFKEYFLFLSLDKIYNKSVIIKLNIYYRPSTKIQHFGPLLVLIKVVFWRRPVCVPFLQMALVLFFKSARGRADGWDTWDMHTCRLQWTVPHLSPHMSPSRSNTYITESASKYFVNVIINHKLFVIRSVLQKAMSLLTSMSLSMTTIL